MELLNSLLLAFLEGPCSDSNFIFYKNNKYENNIDNK